MKPDEPNQFGLETPRLYLKRPSMGARMDFARLNSNPQVMKFFPGVLSEKESDELLQLMCTHFETNSFGMWLVYDRANGEFMGFTGLGKVPFEADFTPAVEIGWRFLPEYWGRGFAIESAQRCISFCFENLNLKRIVSFTADVNLPSIGLMKRLGMRFSHKFTHPRLDPTSWLSSHSLFVLDSGTNRLQK